MKAIAKIAEHWDSIVLVLGIILAIVRAGRSAAAAEAAKGESSKFKQATAFAVAAAEAIAALVPKADADKVKATKHDIKALATEAGVEGALSQVVTAVTKGAEAIVDANGKLRGEVVKKATVPERRAVDANGLPKLAAIAFVLLMVGAGCVNKAIHGTAVELHNTLSDLKAASVPNPAYKTQEEIDAYKALWSEAEAAAKDIAEATK